MFIIERIEILFILLEKTSFILIYSEINLTPLTRYMKSNMIRPKGTYRK